MTAHAHALRFQHFGTMSSMHVWEGDALIGLARWVKTRERYTYDGHDGASLEAATFPMLRTKVRAHRDKVRADARAEQAIFDRLRSVVVTQRDGNPPPVGTFVHVGDTVRQIVDHVMRFGALAEVKVGGPVEGMTAGLMAFDGDRNAFRAAFGDRETGWSHWQ